MMHKISENIPSASELLRGAHREFLQHPRYSRYPGTFHLFNLFWRPL